MNTTKEEFRSVDDKEKNIVDLYDIKHGSSILLLTCI